MEFKGYISESVYKRLRKKSLIFFTFFNELSALLVSSIWFILAGAGRSSHPILVGCGATLCTMLGVLVASLIPPSKKTRESQRFYHIFFDGEYIVVKIGTEGTKTQEFFRRISDAKCVRDYGDFYEVVYAIINPFICQKDLISGGTLEEFEALFEGKIERVYEKKRSKKI